MAQTSSQRIRAYSKALAVNCRKPRIVIIISAAVATVLAIFQLAAVGTLRYGYSDIYRLSTFIFFISIGCGVFLIPPLFKELYNRQFADVEFSLPMSSSERYLAKILAIVKYHILPIAASQAVVLTAAMILIGGRTMKGFVIYAILLLTALVFIDAVAVFCVCCCGSLAECIYTPVIFSAILTLLPAAFYGNVIANTANVGTNLSTAFRSWALFPVIVLYDESSLFEYASFYNISAEFIISTIVNVLIWVGVVFLTLRIYKRRDGLQTGKPFVHRPFYYAFVYLGVSAVLTSTMFNEFYYGIIFSLLGFVIISTSAQRGKLTLRSFGFQLMHYTAALFIVMGIGYAAFITQGFGKSYDKPAKDLGEKCNVDITITDRTSHREFFFNFNEGDHTELVDKLIDDARSRSKQSRSLSDYYDMLFYDTMAEDYYDTSIYIYCNRYNEVTGNFSGYNTTIEISQDDIKELEALIMEYSPDNTDIVIDGRSIYPYI